MAPELALEALSREERFMGTLSAMNALLVKSGLYSTAEFQATFLEWASAEIGKPSSGCLGKN
jgi:hypothetical protein